MDLAAEAGKLVTELVTQPWGRVSPSVYETSRLVTLAPWLIGHAERVDYLLEVQRADGGWGGPGGYALVPTLGATEALLTEAGRWGSGGRLAEAIDRGLRLLFAWSAASYPFPIPDMPAIELIVASLVERLDRHLSGLGGGPEAPLARWRGASLAPPARASLARLARFRDSLAGRPALPEKLLHALEVAGEAAGGLGVRPTSIGSVGASPAATAAWLSAQPVIEPSDTARRHLESVVRRHGGPVPCGMPVTVFERGWVLSSLVRAGIRPQIPEEVLWSLGAASGHAGTAAGPGLPADADTTAVALYSLSLLGMSYEPAGLWAYETDTHFCTWQGEEGDSPTVNAHVLDAFGTYVTGRAEPHGRYRAAIEKVSNWLREQQSPEGAWSDRWHASPYYATACCALALAGFGGARSAGAVRRATDWVMATQRPDGSWGRWSGTVEETAYAVLTLAMTGPVPDARGSVAAARGREYIRARLDSPDDTPLWHDKDLYAPPAIIRAAALAALHAPGATHRQTPSKGTYHPRFLQNDINGH
ncbi:prenyltransferase/squalene oxidase repeat-containing protein [Spongiactinospora sp. 9N601]|uniref:prenyltransferase/squalene oxidase repeat-containing protein n=1 Tax=Spongiactinospora sp. 9N601 TaxID=3375149 RepID=UPI00378AAA94